MKKTRLLVLVSSLLFISTYPVVATSQDLGEDLSSGKEIGSMSEEILGGGFVSQGFELLGIELDSYLDSAQEFVRGQIAGTIDLGGLEDNQIFSVLSQRILEGIQSKIGDLFGVFGYPNPNEIDREIPEIIVNDETEKIEEFTTFGKKELAISSAKRQVMSAYIESRLGEKAQEEKKKQIEGISQLANHSMTAATDAASQNVTQDVLKQIAVQQADQAFISQAMHAELTQLGMNQNMSLSELSNISESLERQEWQNKVDSAAARVSFVDAVTHFSSLF